MKRKFKNIKCFINIKITFENNFLILQEFPGVQTDESFQMQNFKSFLWWKLYLTGDVGVF